MPVDRLGARDAVSVGLVSEPADVTWVDDAGRTWRRVGSCNRCGDCCKTGDPFWRPVGDRHAPCKYYEQAGGVGSCLARIIDDKPDAVANYLRTACRPFPSEPGLVDDFPRCGFSFELVTDGD